LTISQKSELVRKVSQEIKVYSEQFHLDQASENIKSIYGELKDAIFLIGADINIKPTAKYVAFVRRTNFVDIVLYRNQINLFLNLRRGTLSDPRNFARDVSSVGHWGNGDYQVIVTQLSDIGYLISLIR
jgi:predicted transport protein